MMMMKVLVIQMQIEKENKICSVERRKLYYKTSSAAGGGEI